MLYIVAMAVTFLVVDARASLALLELGVAFTLIGKLLAINFSMLQSPNYPKNRRCY